MCRRQPGKVAAFSHARARDRVVANASSVRGVAFSSGYMGRLVGARFPESAMNRVQVAVRSCWCGSGAHSGHWGASMSAQCSPARFIASSKIKRRCIFWLNSKSKASGVFPVSRNSAVFTRLTRWRERGSGQVEGLCRERPVVPWSCSCWLGPAALWRRDQCRVLHVGRRLRVKSLFGPAGRAQPWPRRLRHWPRSSERAPLPGHSNTDLVQAQTRAVPTPR
jgi:hypothetical protein